MFKTASIFIVATTAPLAIPVLPAAAQEISEPFAQRASGLCTQMGFEPGQLEHVYCVESLRESAGNLPLSHRSGYYALAAPMGGERYLAETGFYGSGQLASESRACAGIGLPVGSRAFRQCVGNLDATILEIQNHAVTE